MHCKEISIYVFPEKELRGLSPNFHILVSVSDLYFPTTGPAIFLQQNRAYRSRECINRSQKKECRNGNCGRAVPFGFEFSVLCLCRVLSLWPVLSCTLLYCPVLSCAVLCCLVLSYAFLTLSVLSWSVLCHPVLPWATLCSSAEFLDEIQTNFPPCYSITPTALSWDLYFFKLTQPLTVSVKEKGGKPDRKAYPLPYSLRNPYRNLKSEKSHDFAQKPHWNCKFVNSASALLWHLLSCASLCCSPSLCNAVLYCPGLHCDVLCCPVLPVLSIATMCCTLPCGVMKNIIKIIIIIK